MSALPTLDLLITPEQMLGMSEARHAELVDGYLLEKPGMSKKSGRVGVKLITRLETFVEERRLGEVLGDGVTYRCFPHEPRQVRRPDLSYIAAGRATPKMEEGHVPIAPDLVVEVVSPRDVMNHVLGRVDDFLLAGTPLVWVVVPDRRMALVFRADGSGARLGERDKLDGEDVLPGFSCPLNELFAPPPGAESQHPEAQADTETDQ